MISVSVDFSAITDKLEKAKESVSQEVLIEAVAKGAKIYYDEMRARVPVSSKGHYFHGTSFSKSGTKYYFDSGSLKNSIYRTLSKDNTRLGHAEYHIAWNHRKVPYGFMVEFGTKKTPAHPFMRPAYYAVEQQAVSVTQNHILASVQKALA